MREYATPDLQGFVIDPKIPPSNYQYEMQLIRFAGFGCLNRIAATVDASGDRTSVTLDAS